MHTTSSPRPRVITLLRRWVVLSVNCSGRGCSRGSPEVALTGASRRRKQRISSSRGSMSTYDVFAKEAVAFLNGYDNLRLDKRDSFADLPENKAAVRALIGQAEWLGIQRTNPFTEFTLPQLVLMDLADSFLRWCSDPGNPARWEALFDLR